VNRWNSWEENEMNLRRFYNRNRRDQDFAEEIESHIRHEEDANLARGITPDEARRQAQLRFGNPRTTREREWRYHSFPFLEGLRQDFSFSLRSLRKDPGFTIIALLVIAAGIGVNTAVFSVIDAVLLKPLTYPDPQQLVSLVNTSSRGSFPAPAFRASISGANRPASSSRSQRSISAVPD